MRRTVPQVVRTNNGRVTIRTRLGRTERAYGLVEPWWDEMRSTRMSAPTLKNTTLGSLLVLIASAWPGHAQPRPLQLRATEDLRVESPLSSNVRATALLPGASGEMILAPLETRGKILGFDSAGRALSLAIPIGGRDAEVNWVSRLGWMTNTLWVSDPSFDQVALIDRGGKVTKSLEFPSFVHPSWSDRRKYPVFARLEPLALYSDGTWLVRPGQERSVMSTPEYDKKFSYLMRIGENGAIQRVVARFPRDEDMLDLSVKQSRWTSRIPFHDRTLWDVSADGSRIVTAWRGRGADSATFQVAVLGEKGDTLFSKKLPYTPVAIPKKAVDSALTKFNRSIANMSVEELRGLVAKQIPSTYPPVVDIIAGRDKTTWVEVRGTSLDQHQWIAFDATGTVIGTVALPKGIVLRAADRDHLWGFDSDVDRVKALVRYKVVASPPAKR